MKIEVRQEELGEVDADLLAVGLLEGDSLPAGLAEAPGAEAAKGGYKRLSTLFAGGARVVVAGLGKREELDPERLRVAAALVVKEAGSLEVAALAWALPEGIDPAHAAEAIVTGTVLGSYRYDRFRASDPDEPQPRIESLTLIGPAEAADAAAEAGVVAAATNRARDLQSTPANFATPAYLGERAEEIAAAHDAVTAEVLGREQIEEKKMGGLIAVSQGSAEEPRLIVLRYAGGGSGPTLGLIGKGVTFDTGGISLKPAGGMEDMKWDMGGAGAVTGAMRLLAGRKARANVVGVCALVENMPDGNAQRPGDVLKSMSGQTVEVINTDAEGRLILCDAMWYAQEKFKPQAMVELSTLTGAIIVSLGHERAGLFSNNTALSNKLRAAGSSIGEKLWRMPLGPKYDKMIDSEIADMRNVTNSRDASSITAAQFLQRFVQEGVAWAHLDIAGMAWSNKGDSTTPKGATAYGVRLLDAWIAENYEP